MKKRAALFALLISTSIVTTHLQAQAWRGMARLQGTVVGENEKPLAGAKVMLRSTQAGDSGPDVISDKKGKWAVMGLAGGVWNIDVEAEGYLPKKISVSLSEVQRAPAVVIPLEPLPPPPEPQESEQKEEVHVGGQAVPPEIVAAIEAGNQFMQQQKYKEAIVEYEKAQAVLPTNLPIKQALARAYYASGERTPAIALLSDIHKADPSNTTAALLLANLLLEDDKLDEAKLVLDALPEASTSDAMALVNIGIHFLNKGKPHDADAWFDKAVNLDAESGASYYYRGLARLQLDRKNEARADFEKVIALAPDSDEAGDAREMLAAMK